MDRNVLAAPTPGSRENVFYHSPRVDADRWAEACPEKPSPEGGMALSVRFRPEELPQSLRWAMIGEGTYVPPGAAFRAGNRGLSMDGTGRYATLLPDLPPTLRLRSASISSRVRSLVSGTMR